MPQRHHIENPSALIQWAFDLASSAPEKHVGWLAKSLVDWAVGDGERLLLTPVRLGQGQLENWAFIDHLKEDWHRNLAKALGLGISAKTEASPNGLGFIFAPPRPESKARKDITLVTGALWRGQLDSLIPSVAFGQALNVAKECDKAMMLGEQGLAGGKDVEVALYLPRGLSWNHLMTEEARIREAVAMDHQFEFEGYSEPTLSVLSLRSPDGNSFATVGWSHEQGLIHSVSGRGSDPVDPDLHSAFAPLFTQMGIKGVLEAAAMPQAWVDAHQAPDDAQEEAAPPKKTPRSSMPMS